MNEYIEVSFRKPNGTRLRVKRQVAGGIEFDERDPIERTVGIAINGRGEATVARMRRIGQVKGWDIGQFKLSVSVEDGNLVLRGADPDSLPEGFYTVRVQIEEAQTKQKNASVEVADDGHGTLEVEVSMDDRDVVVDLSDCDPQVRRVLEASTLDGQDAPAWLGSPAWRPTRKACLLNLLASLRARPGTSAPLIDLVVHAFVALNDRVYMKVDRAMLTRVKALVQDPTKPFYAEGTPKAKIHERLLEQIPEPLEVKSRFQGLLSFRGEGHPSLQMVIAVPPPDLPHTYVDFDLDAGNPLQDLVGFAVHMGELFDGKMTNHLDLRATLAKTKAKNYLCYSIADAPRALPFSRGAKPSPRSPGSRRRRVKRTPRRKRG